MFALWLSNHIQESMTCKTKNATLQHFISNVFRKKKKKKKKKKEEQVKDFKLYFEEKAEFILNNYYFQ